MRLAFAGSRVRVVGAAARSASGVPPRALVVVALAAFLVPLRVEAQSVEASFAIGALVGDDIEVGFDLEEDAGARFDDSALFGGRVGWYGFPVGVEAGILYGPSGVAGEADFVVPFDAGLLYVEANALLFFLPGPIQPFVTGGAGVHRITLALGADGAAETALGWNLGGGLKARVRRLSLRADVRDHVTDFDSADALALLGIDNTFHNWEATFGIGVEF